MKKRVITGMMTAVVIVSLAGCGAGQKETVESTAPATMTETVAASQVETAEVTETETTVQADRASRIKAYQAALENIYQNHILPDGSELRDDISGEMSGNKFAVYDVDHDGRDELVLTFYDNATIGAGISHNQGYAGEFWPYTFYTYDAANDSYRAEYFVDAWDKSLSDVNYNGEAFPDDADKDGDGIVYYLDAPDGSETGEPLDRDAFDQWVSENVGNEENIPFQDLTEDAIRQIQ